MGCDLVDLVMDSRLLRVLDETADTSDEDEDEEAALEEQAAVEGGERKLRAGTPCPSHPLPESRTQVTGR